MRIVEGATSEVETDGMVGNIPRRLRIVPLEVLIPHGFQTWNGSALASRLLFAAISIAAAVIPTATIAQTAPSPKAAEQAVRRAQSGNLVGHGGPVKAIAVDGSRALTGSFDYSAILWDVAATEPKLVHRFAEHNGAVNAVAFVSAVRGLTAGDDGVVRLWDLQSGKLVHRFEGHDPGSKIVGLSVSDDGQRAVSAGWDRTARLWDLHELKAGPVLLDHKGPVNAVAFSADGKTVFTASTDGDIRAFDAATGALERRVHSAGQSVNVLMRVRGGDEHRIHRSGSTVQAGRNDLLFGTVHGQSGIVNGMSGDIVHRFPDADRPILSLAEQTFAPSNHALMRRAGTIAVGSGDGKVRVFSDVDAGLLQEFKSAFGPVWALAFDQSDGLSPATSLYYAGLDDFVTLWRFAPRAQFESVDTSQYPRRFQMSGKPDDPVARGEIQFARKCSICHTLGPDSANRAGPTLHTIFGRRIGTRAGYVYSPGFAKIDIVWTPETLSQLFEFGPDKVTPGSKMPLQVMSEKSDRDDLIAFLTIATRDPKPVDDAASPPQKP